MKRLLTLAGVVTLSVGLTGVAAAQGSGWGGNCLDPMNTMPYSAPYLGSAIGNQLTFFSMGNTGTVTYGGQNGPCFGPTAQTFNADGGYNFGVGGAGSVQSAFDDGMGYTFGYPGDFISELNYTLITRGDNTVANAFQVTGFNIFFVGLSDRYLVYGMQDTEANVQLRAGALGDAIRMRWRITNTGAEAQSYGVRFGFTPSLTTDSADSQTGANVANVTPNLGGAFRTPKLVDNYVGYTFLPSRRPLRTEYKRDILDQDFPAYVDFAFGQTEYYGMRIENTPTPQTPDATQADQIVIGNANNILFGGMSDTLFGDPTGTQKDNDIRLNWVSAHQRFPVQVVNPGSFRDVVHYVRTTWSVADYAEPYCVVVDSPHLVNFPGAGTNNQGPNPMPIRVWIDNQFATFDKTVALNNVEVTLTLPNGLSFNTGESPVKTIAQIPANGIRSLDWNLVSDGSTYGDLPVTVTVKSLPGPTKTLTATIRVSAAARMTLQAGPNMVGFPYSFGDNSLDNILGLTTGVDYVAYTWNADLGGYSPTTSIQRGIGYWVVPNSNQVDVALQNASQATDISTGGLLVNLKPGWNMIANPYNYPVALYDLIGVAESNPADSLTWLQMTQQEILSSSLTFFVPNSSLPGGGSYSLTQGNVLIQPQVAYWVFVRSGQPVRLIWPPLFQKLLPNSGRSDGKTFKQTDREWKLQLAARSNMGVDSDNYVGVVGDRKTASQLSLPKAPMAPGAGLELAILDDYSGQPTRMAQAVSDRIGKKTWDVQVKVEEAGEVTVTWPNLGSLPRGLRARLEDKVTGEKKDLRTVSGYTFRMDQPGTRVFTLTVEPGGSSKPVIGNVVVQPAGRDNNSPVVVNYALSADASVTVRILSSTGKEVYTVTRGRSDSAGENSVTWTLRDNANRAVAPGTYRVEILAETPSGERVRKVVPVNVIR